MNKGGRPRKYITNLKYSISLDPEIADYVDHLMDSTKLKRSQIIAMAIKHFYRACMAECKNDEPEE